MPAVWMTWSSIRIAIVEQIDGVWQIHSRGFVGIGGRLFLWRRQWTNVRF